MKKKKATPAPERQATPITMPGLPDWAAIAILLALSLLLFAPYLTGSKMLFGTDWMSGRYAGSLLTTELTRQFHQLPMWMPYVAGGQPTVASASAADFFYPITVPFRLIGIPIHVVWTYTFIFHLFLAGFGTFYFLKKALKLGPYPALIGALAYMFTGFLVSHTYAGHDGKLICEAWFPLMMLFLHLGLERLQYRWFIFAGGAMALAVHSGHVQSAYYSGLISAVYFMYFVWRRWKEKVWLRQLAGYALMLAILVALAAIYYFPILANLGQGIRGADKGGDAYQYAVSWSMPLVELWDFITPKFVGVLDNYWGPNYFKLHLRYLGILPVLLAALAVAFTWKQQGTKFWAGLFGFSLLMALGGSTPFYRLAYLLPGIKRFRGPDLIFYVVAFATCVLAAIGVQYLGQQLAAGDERRKKRFTVGLIAAAGALLLVLAVFALGRDAITDLMTGHYYPAYSAVYGSDAAAEKAGNIAKNYPDLLGGLLTALLLLAVNGALLVALVRRKLNLRAWALIAGIILVLDLWHADIAFIKPSPAPDQAFPADEVTAFLKRDQGLYRVFPMYYNKSEEPLINHVQIVGGNIPNPLQRYQEFLGATGALGQAPNLMYPGFLDLLNVKYIVGLPLPQDTMPYDPQSRQMIRSLRAYFSRFTPVFQGQQYAVYRNDHALPRAWLAPRYQVIASSGQLLAALKLMPDPGGTALLEKDPGIALPGTAAGTAAVTFFSPNRIDVTVTASAPAVLVLSENYHPDWMALIDGKPAPVLPAYHTLRAVLVGAGGHHVTFQYRSEAYRTGKIVTIIGVLMVIGTIIWSLAAAVTKRRAGAPAGTAPAAEA